MVKKTYVVPPGKDSKVVIEDLKVKFQEGATIILGFAGAGLIGTIVTNTLVEQIQDIKEIGFITSNLLPSISVFYQGMLKNPFRLYYSAQHNLIIGVVEVPFQIPSAYNDLAKTICNWALSEEVKAHEILVFQGYHKHGLIDEFPVHYASEADMVETFENLDLKKFERGIISGAEATIINEALTNKLKAAALFTPAYQIPTPEGAAAILEVLNSLYNFNIDTSKLIEQGKEIKVKMLELADKSQEFQRQQLPQDEKEGYTQYYQ